MVDGFNEEGLMVSLSRVLGSIVGGVIRLGVMVEGFIVTGLIV